MGSSGLYTYIKRNKELFSRKLSVVSFLFHCFMIRNGPINAVIDGSSFIHGLYHCIICRGFRRAFSYRSIESLIKRVLNFLNMERICIKAFLMDGTDDYEKIETYQARRSDKSREIQRMWNSGFKAQCIFMGVFLNRSSIVVCVVSIHNNKDCK